MALCNINMIDINNLILYYVLRYYQLQPLKKVIFKKLIITNQQKKGDQIHGSTK